MLILGLNAYHADSSAAILVDGELAFAVAEERLNRHKHWAGFPIKSIQACLDAVGARLEDVDHVAIGRDPKANISQKLAYALRHPEMMANFLRLRSRGMAVNDLRRLFARHMDVDKARLRFRGHHVEHHIAHAASAFFPSDFEEAATLSFDGSGDFVTVMFAQGRANRLDPVYRIFGPNSLGNFYTAGCQFVGYQKYGDEGKVMGLAPYGTDSYQKDFDEMVVLTDNGFRLDSAYFRLLGADMGFEVLDDGTAVNSHHVSDRWSKLFGDPRMPYTDFAQRDMDLVHGMQRRFEEVTFHLLKMLHRRVPTDGVSIAGGCALNSSANGKIFDHTPFERTWIQPAAGDEGLSIGAAMYVYHHVLGYPRKFVMNHAYWGSEYSEAECQRALDTAGLRYRKLLTEEQLGYTADRLVDKAIVGWFQGRMEWGPRALGNRSILTHPGPPEMKDTLNARIKHREWFRPFAPSILSEYQPEYFENSHPSPFMLHVFNIKPERRDELGAVTHVDGTGRLQSVAHDENPLYYDLISAFHQRTGTPVLLNTSFNDNEPIVCRPEEAVDCFMRTKMDLLCLGPFVVEADQRGR